MATTVIELTTAEELLRLSARSDKRYELIAGDLQEMSPAQPPHGEIALLIGSDLLQHLRQHGLGRAYGAETGFLLARNPDTVLAPDAAVILEERVPPRDTQGYWEVAPDMVVEVLSPSDSPGRVAAKVQLWLHYGVRLVWVVDPDESVIRAHTSDQPPRTYHKNDEIIGAPVLPEFRALVSSYFIEA